MNRRHRIPLLLQVAAIFAAFCVAMICRLSADSTPASIVTGGWSHRLMYDPPNERHLQMDLSGSEATNIPDSGGKVWIKDITIKQYALTGGNPQMTAEAPE